MSSNNEDEVLQIAKKLDKMAAKKTTVRKDLRF